MAKNTKPSSTKFKSKRVVRGRSRPSKRPPLLLAPALGVLPEQLVSPAPPANLPIAPESYLPSRDFRRLLVAPRTSFWLGVGFGMLVVGSLMFTAWYLLRVELVEAVVVTLTRP